MNLKHKKINNRLNNLFDINNKYLIIIQIYLFIYELFFKQKKKKKNIIKQIKQNIFILKNNKKKYKI